MKETTIGLRGLGKQYRIGAQRQRYKTLRESLTGVFTAPIRPFASARRGLARHDTIWALKDVSFDVHPGDVVGIIGRNGAGKSTLLKILSRITEPTEGFAEIHGRVGSLLEVGTGFHAELTGRENIYLNGAILGMRRKEIDRQFDEIVAFAEVDRFIDTPVKHYSSGMYLRLAFGVAAHLESEILLVDEVLAVGDAAFQKKCIGKMGDVAEEGRTVLFVSHNMAAINQLCSRCLVFDGGSLSFDGAGSAGIDQYLKMGDGDPGAAVVDTSRFTHRSGTGRGQIVRVEILDGAGRNGTCFGTGEPFAIRFHATLEERVPRVSFGAEVVSHAGIALLNLRTDSQGLDFGPYNAGDHVIFTIEVPGFPFYPGVYRIAPWFAARDGKKIDYIESAVSVTIEARGHYQSELLIQPGRGILIMDCTWSASVAGAQ